MSLFIPSIFSPRTKPPIKVYLDHIAFSDKFVEQADRAEWYVRKAFMEVEKAGNNNLFLFAEVPSSADCEIFVTFSEVDDVDEASVDPDSVAITTTKTRPDGRKYVEMRFDSNNSWGLRPLSSFWWANPRNWFTPAKHDLCRWAIHELLHALGCGHTETRQAQHLESLLDQENWGSRRTTVPPFDAALLCARHGKDHPFRSWVW